MKAKPEYKPLVIEEKWRKKWEKSRIYQPDLDKAKKPFYNLMMFPYPSAEGLHVGSVFTFTGVDTYGRFKRMQGYEVFEPMGLDGFGIHSENYALKVGRHPKEQAKISEENFYRQLRIIGNSFDWSRKLETYDPNYYKWTQWIFIQLFNRGLAYRKKAPVNFCPKDLTVLADEQVIDGKCERCSSIVEKRQLEQWFFKITDYADRLLKNIPKLNWTNKVKIAQEQWIGKSKGVSFRYKVKDLDIHFEMFDSVPQTFMAQTFTVIAPEHAEVYELVKDTEYEKPVMEFVEQIKQKKKVKKFDLEKEPEGIFTGRYVEYKPTGKNIPIWVASFVIAEYGSGVVNASAHDERDFAFAKKYNLPLHPVMFPKDPKEAKKVRNLEYCYHHASDGILQEPVEFKGRKWGEVREDIISYIERHRYGKSQAQYHLRDWLISRQRYWGPPIPMIFCQKCADEKKAAKSTSIRTVLKNVDLKGQMYGWYPVPEEQLPVLLPDVKDWKPRSSQSSSGQAVSPLASVEEFVNTTCPNCGGPARRETDVTDVFLDSAWYFFRYISTEFNDRVFDKERVKKWLPVTMYIGGAEHSVLHLLYSRFVTMVFKDMGLIDFEEPYSRFYAHGLIIKDGSKMSKSKGNVINPDEYLNKYGADTIRAYLRFVGPFDMGGNFRDSGIEGMHRFLKRVWRLIVDYFHSELVSGSKLSRNEMPNQVRHDMDRKRMFHKTIKGVTEDLENLRFNTAVAKLMSYYNYLSRQKEPAKKEVEMFVMLLAPFTPFLAEELWEKIGGSYSVHLQPWPTYDPSMLQEAKTTIVVQVNGKLRDSIKVQSSSLKVQSQVETMAKRSKKLKKYLSGQKIKKIIYVPGKIINFVV